MIELITGGAASGKSAYAEQRALACGRQQHRQMIYLAAMHADTSEETAKRIMRHRKMRSGKPFQTIEQESHLEKLKMTERVILLEDLSNLLTNEMFLEHRGAEEVYDEVVTLGTSNDLIVVTNEIFSDGRTYDAYTEQFIRNLAELNRRIAAHPQCRSVTEVVASIPVKRY